MCPKVTLCQIKLSSKTTCGSVRKAAQLRESQKEVEVFEGQNTLLIINLSMLAFLEQPSWAPCDLSEIKIKIQKSCWYSWNVVGIFIPFFKWNRPLILKFGSHHQLVAAIPVVNDKILDDSLNLIAVKSNQ